MTLNEAGARLESQLAPRTAAHMLPRTLPSLLLTSRPRLQVVPDLSNRRCRSPHTARLRSSDRRRGQLSFWNQDDPCVPLPTLDFDTLVDTYFLVRPAPPWRHSNTPITVMRVILRHLVFFAPVTTCTH